MSNMYLFGLCHGTASCLELYGYFLDLCQAMAMHMQQTHGPSGELSGNSLNARM